MTRKKKLSLYIKELERDREDLSVRLTFHTNKMEEDANDISFFTVKYLEHRLKEVERVIHTLSTINEKDTK